jgi:endonuclease/exonuclease/phosphatase family metal-dependent hydrolase
VLTVRVMSYNIRSLRDDRAAVARVIRAADPDVLCIQEAPRFFRWRAKCARLAADTGLLIASGGRRAAANLILLRPGLEIESARSVLFSKDPRLHQRGVAIAVIRGPHQRVLVAGTHLDGYPIPRLRHVGELFAAIDDEQPPCKVMLLAGDFNDDPGTPVWDALAVRGVDSFAVAGAGDGLTLNVTEPTRRIDAIFVAGATVRAARSIDSEDVRIASDHRPVLAEIAIGPLDISRP